MKNLALAFALGLLATTSACSFRVDKAQDGEGGGALGLDLRPGFVNGFNRLSTAVFQSKCVNCHRADNASGGVDLSSYTAMMSKPGIVVPGNADNSRVYAVLLPEAGGGRMPQLSAPLSDAEISSIRKWIMAGAPEADMSLPDGRIDSPSGTGPSPAPVCVPETGLTRISFQDVKSRILQKQCIGCHSGSSARAGVDLTSLDSLLAKPGILVPGKPSESAVYTACAAGRMPLGRNASHVSADDIQFIQDWILQCAPDSPVAEPDLPNADPSPLPSPSPSPTGDAQITRVTFEKVRAQILEPQCAKCHGPGKPLDVTNYNQLLTARGMVNPGDAAGSRLIKVLLPTARKRMPLGSAPLSDADVALLSAWISEGAYSETLQRPEPAPVPAPSPQATPSPMPTEAPTITRITFGDVSKQVLGTKCAMCHTGGSAQAGVDVSSLDALLKAPGILTPGSPDKSKLYTACLPSAATRMPLYPGPLSDSEMKLLYDWIEQGAN